MPAYEGGDFLPPAPVARVVVRGPAGQSQSDLPMLIDTGADVSILPRRVAVDLSAEIRLSDISIRLYDGSEVVCDSAELSVDLLRYTFRGAFLIADSEYGVLGRNVLNLLLLSLDGPCQLWSA